MVKTDCYEKIIQLNAPKVMSQIDRDKHSRTYGCCDRNHWHLKTRDFSSAILQQAGLSCLLLYLLNFDNNEFYNKNCVREWAKGTLSYWCLIQLKDGSFNEYYPNEHGFPPTAFSLYAMCEVYKRLKIEDDHILRKLKKTGRYLTGHIEKKACNQEMASITALYSLYTICKETWVIDGIEKKLSRLLNLQSAEGWFPEYGGADIGYQSVLLDMLAEYYWMSHDERVLEALNRSVEFLAYFIHPDGTSGGEYGSRNTTYFLPNGLEVMSILGNKTATAMIDKLYESNDDSYYFMAGVDDRYWSHYILHSFLRALEKRMNDKNDRKKISLPWEYDQKKWFPEAGLFSMTNGSNYLIVGARKGGIIKLWKNGNQMLVDCGYRVNYGNGKIAATNWQDLSYEVIVKDKSISIRGRFNKIALKVPTPILHMGLRVVSKIVGNKVIGILKNKMILVDKHDKNIEFRRIIEIQDGDRIEVRDEFLSLRKLKIESANNYSLRHVASGKFFSLSDLCFRPQKSFSIVGKQTTSYVADLKNGKIY